MNAFLPLVRKDCRRARGWIAATWFLAALPLALTLFRPADGNAVGFLQAMAVGALITNAARLIQLDPADDPCAFLSTRPAGYPAILRAKLAVIFCALILPVAALHTAQIAALRIPLTAADYGLLSLETLWSLAAVTLAALVPAFFCQSLGGYLMTAVLCTIAVMGASLLVRWDAPAMPILDGESYRLGLSRQVAVLFFCPVVALAVMAVHARWRSRLRTGVVFGLAAAGVLLVRIFWPVDFLHRLAPGDRHTPASECPDMAQVSAHFEKMPGWGGPEPHFNGIEYNGLNYQNVQAFVRFQGIPAPWYPVQRAFRSTLTLGNGTPLPCHGTLAPYINLSQWLAQQDLHPRPDISPKVYTHLNLDQYKADAIRQAPQNAALRGEATVELRRVVVLGELPLEEGASLTLNRQRYTVCKVSYSENHLRIEIAQENIRVLLRAESTGFSSLAQFPLVNMPHRNFVESRAAGAMESSTLANYTRNLSHLEYEPDRQPGAEAFPIRFTSEWIHGARLLLVGTESGGSISVPFAFESCHLLP